MAGARTPKGPVKSWVAAGWELSTGRVRLLLPSTFYTMEPVEPPGFICISSSIPHLLKPFGVSVGRKAEVNLNGLRFPVVARIKIGQDRYSKGGPYEPDPRIL